MKKIINLLLTSFIAAGLTACWSEDIPEAGASRRQVTDLTATPGDEEVLLAWNLPEGWNPTDFIVYYTDADSETVTLRTGGKMNCTVDGLVNGMQYTFYVQAVYGKLVSNYVTVLGRPATTRFPITDLTVDAGDSFVSLSWTKPATTVLSYTLSYYNEDAPDDIERQTLDKEATSVTLDGLTNDKNYYFSLAANYEKGVSEPATAKAMPTLAIPYILDRDQAAKNQPITFTFNTEDYPTATDVRWTFPGEVVKEGTVVKYGLGTVGTQTVKLNATIDGNARSWTLEVEIREYVIYSTDWAQDGSNYNGFKGTCPVFSPDGKTVYIVTFNKLSALYAFDVATGSEKWRYKPAANTGSYNMLTVNPVTGDIYYGTQTPGHFYAVTSEGSLKWVFEEAGSMQSAAPAVNAAGTAVYICDKSGNTFAIDAASGQKIWNFTAGVPGGGLLVNGSELLIGAESNAFFVNIETGEQIAKVALGCKMSDITGFAVSSDKTLAYFGAASGYIGAVDLTTHTAKSQHHLRTRRGPQRKHLRRFEKRLGLQREGRPFGRQLGARPHRKGRQQHLQLFTPVRRLRKPVLHHGGTDDQHVLYLRRRRQGPRLVELHGNHRRGAAPDGRQQLSRRRVLFGVHRQRRPERHVRREIRRRRTRIELEHPRRRYLRIVLH